MSFWGVEVKPENPVTHSCRKSERRVRITQATLGVGSTKEKSVLQCTVGKKGPVFLCALLPNNVESCNFQLEFEGPDEVIFSVIGHRSIHLTGYYVHYNQPSYMRSSDTESCGIYIENTAMGKSNHNTEDDKYEDSFVDDNELPVPAPSPVVCYRQGKKCRGKQDMRKQLRKKNQVIDESDNDAKTLLEGDDEDGCPISVFNSKKKIL